MKRSREHHTQSLTLGNGNSKGAVVTSVLSEHTTYTEIQMEQIQWFFDWQKKIRGYGNYENAAVNEAETIQGILNTLGKGLQADRVFLAKIDDQVQALPIEFEYRKNESIKPMLGTIPLWQDCPYLKKTADTGQVTFAFDALEDSQVRENAAVCRLVEEMAIRGVVVCPVTHQDKLLSVLVVHTEVPQIWATEALSLALVAADQISLSMVMAEKHHAEKALRDSEERYQLLYQWEKKTREVLQQIRQPLEINEIFSIVVNVMAKALHADRCFIVEFDERGNVCPVRFEYRSQESVKPFTGICPPWDFCPYLAQTAKNQLACATDTYDDANVEDNPAWHEFSRYYNIRGIITAPILYQGKLINVLVMHTMEPREWEEQELFFTQVVTSQISTSFYQAKVKEQLIKASLMKSQFVSNMSHELRTPLNSIIGYAEMLEKGMGGELTEKQHRYVQNVVTSGRHLLNLINDVLDLSKIEAGKIALNIEKLSIEAILKEIQGMFREMAKQKSVQLAFHVAPGLDVVEADPARLRQILINLIGNAIKFNIQGGSVEVQIFKSHDSQWVLFKIEDTGIGIPKNQLPELFTEFYQVDNSTTRGHEGTGLGLALTKRLVELHGGSIAVESTVGVGSTFIIKLPTQPFLALQ